MDSTVKPKQADDPHDLLEVAPGVALVAPSNAGDPTDEEISNLLRSAARQRSGTQTRKKSDVAAGSSAPAVDTAFRPAAVNKVRSRGVRSSMGRRAIRGVIGFVIALSIVVGAAAWQLYGDAATQMVATWVPRLGPAPSPQDLALAEQQSPAAVPASEVTAASDQSADSAPQGVVPAAAAEAPTLQSMARDVATLGQKVEQLQATIEQLRASQDQMSRDLARGSEGKTSEAKASEQNLRPRTFPPAPRPAVVPPRKPIAAFRQPQVTAAPVSPPSATPYYGQRQPEPSPSAQLTDPELSSVPRPPLPLHQ
ncbi:MAG: hypothetical protein ACXWLB_22170 [Reyranella sp.]